MLKETTEPSRCGLRNVWPPVALYLRASWQGSGRSETALPRAGRGPQQATPLRPPGEGSLGLGQLAQPLT